MRSCATALSRCWPRRCRYVEQFIGEVDEQGHWLVVRNGYHAEREVITPAGAVPVSQQRVNDRRTDEATGERRRFSSAMGPGSRAAGVAMASS
jgi:hypothetical protein